MCLRDTVTRFALSAAVAVWAGGAANQAFAQAFAQTNSTSWKRVAGTSVSEALASPASGPVSAIWYAAGTGQLLAQTASGRIFETTDFAHWKLNTTDAAPQAVSRVQSAGIRQYRVGSAAVYASDDGRAWLDLTGFNGKSVIGDGFTALATSPRNSQEISVANRFGVWRSLDAGLSWSGLNEDLPNLLVRRLLARRTIMLADGTTLTVNAGAWATSNETNPETALLTRFKVTTNANVSAVAQAGSQAYAGTADGRLLSSRDEGATWTDARIAGDARIDRIWVDNERPEVALAAAGQKLLRTINGGLFWDDVSGAMPASQIHGIAADRSAGVVYIATDRGVFSGNISLSDAGPAAPNWTAVSGNLPAAAAWDVLLNPDNTLTVALDGYGVFEAPAPHHTRRVRIVNGADMSDRAAAPGSLISVLGASVSGVKVGGVAYPVIAASEQSSQLQVPFDAASGTFSLALETGTDRWTAPLTVKDAAPVIFVDADGAPLILDAASGLVLDPNVAVRADSTVQLMATGLGKVSPEWPAGVPAPLDFPPVVTAPVMAFLDGTPVKVTKATLAPGYAGYYVIELQIPAIVNRGAGELRIVMNGEESNRVKLYLEPDR
jgi:uncharacterized protein (TIGR03437 family)